MLYLWMKAFHVFFVVSWFAGLFYLPRIFVNLAQIRPDTDEYRRLLGMAQRLKRFMLILMLGTLIFGSAIMLSNGMEGFYLWLAQKWLWAKTALVLVLFGYDGYCSVLLREFVGGRNRRQHVWYRWFNEVPTFILLAVCILAIVKPF
ncbi:MAG: CopD family protein [Uliginosibacterium sp.]|jgi:putative membrane protein|nr:CopD family protein [Uliginosibacterium sp.]MBK9393370.1 CopD family protein [Uliginosibacterium sp.]MBK9615332.1 CopD family protein [Uliginosibacterium sp.]